MEYQGPHDAGGILRGFSILRDCSLLLDERLALLLDVMWGVLLVLSRPREQETYGSVAAELDSWADLVLHVTVPTDQGRIRRHRLFLLLMAWQLAFLLDVVWSVLSGPREQETYQ